MKQIIFIVTLTLILGSGMAFAAEASKMQYNGITVFEEPPASSSALESKNFYNGITIFRTGPADFERIGFVNGLPQFSDCRLPKSTLSKVGANSTI